MISAPKLLIRLVVFATAMIVLLAVVFQVISRPVSGETSGYTAMFTDANGLKTGDDVRMYGVSVGKVAAIDLDGVQARVKFSVQNDRPVYTNTTLAIRYQNLTGMRYLDIQQPPDPAAKQRAADTITTDHTIPAFDVTTLFNGLQPVLATLTPADINQLMESMLAVVEGDSTRVGSALDGIQNLTEHYVSDRQAVVSTLVHNLGEVLDHLGGKSSGAMKLIAQLTTVFGNLADRLIMLINFLLVIRPVLYPLESLLKTVGMDSNPNQNLQNALSTAIPNPKGAADTLGRLPGLIQGLAEAIPATGPEVDLACSKGSVVPPPALQVLIQGQRVSLCNK